MGQVLPAERDRRPLDRQRCCRHSLDGTFRYHQQGMWIGDVRPLMADRGIRSGDLGMVVAGGMESMSQAPHYLRRARSGWKYGDQPLLDAIDLGWSAMRLMARSDGVSMRNKSRSDIKSIAKLKTHGLCKAINALCR